MKAIFDEIRAKLRAIGSEREKLEQELETLRQERDDLMTAPLPLDEHLARLDAAIDAARDAYLTPFRRNMVGLESDPFAGPPQPQNLFVIGGGEPQAIQRALFALLGPEIKSALRRLYAGVDWQPGPPLAERQKRLAVLDKRIGEIEATLEQMSAEADAAGLRFGTVDPPPRPELFRGGRLTAPGAAHRAEEMDRRRRGETRGK